MVGEALRATGAAQPPLDEALDEPVLRRVDDVVDAREHGGEPGRVRPRLGRLAVLAAVEALEVEVDAEHERQHDERDERRATGCP